MRLSDERLLRVRILSHTGDKIHIKLPVGFVKKMIKNKSIEQIADELEEDVSKIQKIYDIAKEFAPDYNVEKIMAKLG